MFEVHERIIRNRLKKSGCLNWRSQNVALQSWIWMMHKTSETQFFRRWDRKRDVWRKKPNNPRSQTPFPNCEARWRRRVVGKSSTISSVCCQVCLTTERSRKWMTKRRFLLFAVFLFGSLDLGRSRTDQRDPVDGCGPVQTVPDSSKRLKNVYAL